MAKKKSKKEKPQIHPELEGFEITINEFGQISSNYDLNKVYNFLNKNVEDKKLKNLDKEEDAGEKKKSKKKKPKGE